MKDSQPDDFQAKLLANGVGIVKTHVKRVAKIPGKKGQLEEMEKLFKEDPNPRYTQVWIWTMTLMRAATAAYADVDHFEKGKVAGSGSSKNGISPAVALINDERFTATCSNHWIKNARNCINALWWEKREGPRTHPRTQYAAMRIAFGPA